MKKLTIFTLVLALFLSLSSVAFAADKEIKAGEEVTLTFGFGEKALAGYQGYITYNTDELTFEKASSTYATEEEPGKVKVSYVGNAVSEVTATFKAKKAGTTATATLELTSAALEDETRVTVNPVQDSVKILPEEGEQQPGGVTPNNPNDTQTPGGSDSPVEPGSQTPAGSGSSATNSNSQTPASNSATVPAEFDQTGVNVAIVAVVALVIIAGAIVLIKRK